MSLIKLSLTIFISCLLAACASTSGSQGGDAVAEGSAVALSENAAENASSEAKSLAAKDEKICKTEAITGSRFKRKLCATAAEWERMSQESSRMINDSNIRGMQGNPDGG